MTTKEVSATGPKGMMRVLNLFESLARHPEGLSLSDLAIQLQEPKSTLLNSLRALEGDAYLNSEGALYHLGPRAFRLAAQVTSSWSLPRLMRSYLQKLACEAEETSLLSVIDANLGRFVHIDGVASPHPVRYVMSIGSSGPLYATAAGRVLLAYQSEAYLDRYLSQCDFEPLTPRTTVDPDSLRQQLAQIRKTKVWLSKGEVINDGAAIASPIFGPDGACVAALGIALPMARLTNREEGLKGVVAANAAHASGERHLGV